MSKAAAAFFKYRSYTPIPFLLIMFFYENANIWSLILGFVISVAGELIRLWGVSYAGSETRTTTVGGSYLVISGPFAHVRNPLYLGNILMYFGIGVMSFALFPYLQIIALLFFTIQYQFIVSEEENYLQNSFGEKYSEYKKKVPRFFPRVSAYRNNELQQPKFSLKAGIRSERRTFQAFGFVCLTIILLWFFRRM
jgi:protein-S-isoprenylcysteine O-methyltransferase Ste14